MIISAQDWAAKQQFQFTHDKLIETFGDKFALNSLPDDFKCVSCESVILVGDYLIIGEYAEDSARLIVATANTFYIESFYNNILGIRHIHSIHTEFSEKNTILIATGDGRKVLDRWFIHSGKLEFISRVKKRLAGYTAATSAGGIDYFGTDFSSRPNYLETLSADKYPFPKAAYTMFVARLESFRDRYLYVISQEHGLIGNKAALSIFDTQQKVFIYCDYIDV